MRILSRSFLLALSLAATSCLEIRPSWAESVPKEQLIASKITTVKVTELTIKPPLSPEQESQFLEIDEEYQSKLKKAIEDYETSLNNFESLLGTNPETDTLRQRYKQMLDARRTIRDLAFNRLMDFREALTPEQKASLSDDVRQILEK